jgi:hypothetical protein
MGISLVGHSPSFEIWVFNVNGKQFVGRNYSTQDPLQLSFRGVWEKYSGTAPLINTSGFNITESTDKTAIWTWGGKQYTSWWLAISADDEDPDAMVELKFGPAVPYSGPPVSPVGTTVKTKDEREAAEAAAAAVTSAPAAVTATAITPSAQLSTATPTPQSPETPKTVTVSPTGPNLSFKTKDEREAAEAAAAAASVTSTAITPSAQLSTSAPTPQSPETPKTVTVSPTGPNVTFSNKTKEDVEASTAYQNYAYSNQTPVRTSTPQTPVPQTPVGITQSPVIIPGTKDAREAAAAGPDWVKLALQVGAAYLLFS